MKSINILSFLLLSSTFSLVAFAQSFTSENPIVLPTTSHDDDNLVLPEVYDDEDHPLRIGQRYIIDNPYLGAGAVYLDNIGNLKCPNAVLQHIAIPKFLGKGTPVKFVRKSEWDDGDVVRVMTVVYIKFFPNITSLLCVNETVWKVNDEELVVTGGKVGNENDIFKIMKTDLVIPGGSKNVYKLLHCPSHLGCKNIGGNFKNGYPRLVTVDDDKDFIPFVFIKA
ncbi:cysteine protease inhibitor 1-like [Solanum verrucosum]|uniref:cysteine protease inhibitor 1-like n=1 Tax=Solanum verrucosum TaxID=315347 RepID=UPI0020D1C6B4|nr:cysteine protease inhibitor 1-like [Solanum verrucosum]